jgi:hypothetical protein
VASRNNMDFDGLLDSFWSIAQQGRIEYLIPFLEGEAGISKTFSVRTMAKRLKTNLKVYNLSCVDATDITGMPYNDQGITRYARPAMLEMEEGILFLDELNRITNEDVKTGLLSLFVDREINGHKLNPKVLIVTAGNPAGGKYSVKPMDRAFEDRIMKIPFSRSYDEFLDYMFATHNSNELLKFYFANPSVFNSRLKEGDLKYSFRRLEYAFNIYTYGGGLEETLALSLSPEVLSGFRDFKSKSLASYPDLKAGRWRAEAQGSDAILSRALLIDLLEDLKKYPTFNDLEGKRLNEFIRSLNAQNKDYFMGQVALILSGEKFLKVRGNWGEVKIFSGNKQFLDVILG